MPHEKTGVLWKNLWLQKASGNELFLTKHFCAVLATPNCPHLGPAENGKKA